MPNNAHHAFVARGLVIEVATCTGPRFYFFPLLCGEFAFSTILQECQQCGRMIGCIEHTANDPNFVNLNGLRIVKFKLDILEDKSPNVITEAIGIEMALETHSRFYFFTQDLSDDLVKVCHYFDGELGFDAARADQVVEGVCEGAADAGEMDG
jgi:hypothetical protein